MFMYLTFNLLTDLFFLHEISSEAMYTEWHFLYWGRGKGSHIGVVVRACVLPCMRSGFQSHLGTSIHYIQLKIYQKIDGQAFKLDISFCYVIINTEMASHSHSSFTQPWSSMAGMHTCTDTHTHTHTTHLTYRSRCKGH